VKVGCGAMTESESVRSVERHGEQNVEMCRRGAD
jgi:hypothetical protein